MNHTTRNRTYLGSCRRRTPIRHRVWPPLPQILAVLARQEMTTQQHRGGIHFLRSAPRGDAAAGTWRLRRRRDWIEERRFGASAEEGLCVLRRFEEGKAEAREGKGLAKRGSGEISARTRGSGAGTRGSGAGEWRWRARGARQRCRVEAEG